MNPILNKSLQIAKNLEESQNYSQANDLYRKICSDFPDSAEAWAAFGVFAFSQNALKLAQDLFSRAVQLDPLNGLLHRNLGEVSRRNGNTDQAILCGTAAIKLLPNDLDAYFNLGLAYSDAKMFPQAIKTYKKAAKINPNHGYTWNNLGAAQEGYGDKASALKSYEKAVKLNPLHAEAQNNRGAVYSENGELDLARESFSLAINSKPDFVEAHYNLSSLKTYLKDDAHVAILESIFPNRNKLAAPARVRYDFALGKALEDIGSYDRAFAAYDEANRIEHQLLPCDERHADQLVEAIISTFTKEFIEKRKGWAATPLKGKTPIFIIGMPRSGTSLIEQVLATHQSVFGAGELTEFNDILQDICRGNSWLQEMGSITKNDVRKIGKDYIGRVWKNAPESKFITDKMPANFFHLGLIHLALPNAKVIHAMRDPMDSCFSCFSRLFNDTMEFAYDQETLGRYYQRYMRLMNHWKQVLPEGTFLDLPYEKMVSDTEGQAKILLNYLDLPWNPECLEFYKNERLVKTASIAQVRKPIYQTSVARWKHFSKHLKPLYELVKDFRDSADIVDMDFISQPSMPELNKLAERCLTLQGKGEHYAVIEMLAPYLESFGGEIASALFWHLIGISHYRLDNFDKAKFCYEKAIAIEPKFAAAYNSLGFLLQDMGFIEDAKNTFETALQLSPEMSMARLNLSMAQLKLGDFKNGWVNYESRWTGSAESVQGTFVKPQTPLPQWSGEGGTSNQGLIVITEQGFGDTFQFARYLTQAKKYFRKVGFICSAPTLRLMDWAFSNDITLFTYLPRDWSTWDWHCPLMSLPRAFGTSLESIPNELPYLKVPDAAKKHWGEKLNSLAPNHFKVGIAWAGRKVHQYDARRSIAFEKLTPLLSNPKIVWVSLQKWAPEDTRPTIPHGVNWIDWTDELTDFADTAALVENLDLVISIDSSMIHLAGALNKHVWMLNRFDGEWRWLNSKTKSPWYTSLHIFNQSRFGDWDGVIEQVKNALSAALENPNATPQPISPPKNTPVPSAPSTPPQKIISTNEAIQLASQLHESGRLRESEGVLHQILKIDPRHSHALHLLGIITHQSGKTILALDLIREAISIDPNNALFHSNLAEMCRQQGQFEEAITQGTLAVTLDTTMSLAHSNLGIALFDVKRYDDAEISHQKALNINPHTIQSLNNLGSIERARGNKTLALKYYQSAIDLNPDYLEALTNIGAVLVEEDRQLEAIPLLEKVLARLPSSPEALCNLGLCYFKKNELQSAENLLRKSLAAREDYPEALIGLSKVLHEQGEIQHSITLLDKVLVKDPERLDAWCELGSIYTEDGQSDKAEMAFKQVLSRNPSNVDAIIGMSNLKLENGDLKESEKLLTEALQIEPENIGALFHLTQIKKVTPDSELIKTLEKLSGSINSFSEDKQISLHYALGKSYDDINDFKNSFENFEQGAKLKRMKLDYSSDAEMLQTQNIINTFSKKLFLDLQGSGDPSKTPIFILGMPRSGTTLTEQIIASHPQVFGAGELKDLIEVAHYQNHQASPLFPENLENLTKEDIKAMGESYIRRLKEYAPDSIKITDKMPSNYMALGLIPLILPNAKIIHVKRDPIDTCLSCFTRLFNRHQDATYDLTELGRHYNNYRRLMKHWKKILPVGSFLEIEYEALVSNIEEESKKLIEWCDLDWDEKCLSFYKTDRKVRTASLTQVREPAYKTSIARWKNYEPYLEPLISELKKGGSI